MGFYFLRLEKSFYVDIYVDINVDSYIDKESKIDDYVIMCYCIWQIIGHTNDIVTLERGKRI